MTDYEVLRKNLLLKENQAYPKCTTLTKMISLINAESRGLPSKMYIPEYEVDKSYLVKVLEELGYSIEINEEYNNYFEQFCYIIKLFKK